MVSPVKMICDSRIKIYKLSWYQYGVKGQVCFSCLLFKFYNSRCFDDHL